MLLLDTCVVSEGIKAKPNSAVTSWMKFQNPSELFLSAVTLGELHYGVAQLANAARQRELGSWVNEVEKRFASRVIVLDDAVARQWGYLRAANPNARTADAQIAATALTYGLTFATRNVRHFRFDGLSVINPWEA